MNHKIGIEPTDLARFCEQRSIRRLSLFGSRLKGTNRPDSDVDLLVEFDPAHVPGLLGIAAMEIELSELMGGPRLTCECCGSLWSVRSRS